MMFRPRLADEVAVRRHWVDGEERLVLTLVAGADAGASAVIGAREWEILQCADGTRDIAGVLLAAAARGRHCSETQLRAFIARLEQAGMLCAGPAAAPAASSAAPSRPRRPLLQLPNYRLRCDGEGSCCRLYPTTTFSLPEACRARGWLPQLDDAGVHEARVFTPRRGAQLLPWQSRAVSMHDGRCAYLDEAGACRLHSVGGAGAKPQGCQLFPLTFVDDGRHVRVSVAPECSCVYRSPAAEAGAALLAVGGSDELPAAAWIEPARSEVLITSEVAVPHHGYAALRAAILAQAAARDDIAAWLWGLAARLERQAPALAAVRGQPGAGWSAYWDDCLAGAAPTQHHDGRLARRLARATSEQRGWRSGRDFSVRALARVAASARVKQKFPAGAQDARDEQLYLRASAFGDLWLRAGQPPLVEALRQRATRMWLARGMHRLPQPPPDDDPAWAHPLALVEALLRSGGMQTAP